MNPVTFPEQNVTYAMDQPEYIPLPAHRTRSGIVTSCWRFTWWERIRVLFGARLYWSQHTFNGPLQPVSPALDFVRREEAEHG